MIDSFDPKKAISKKWALIDVSISYILLSVTISLAQKIKNRPNSHTDNVKGSNTHLYQSLNWKQTNAEWIGEGEGLTFDRKLNFFAQKNYSQAITT